MKPADSKLSGSLQNRSGRAAKRRMKVATAVRKTVNNNELTVSTASDKNKSNQSVKQKKKHKSILMMVGNRKFKISAKVLKEIKIYQTSIKNLIPKLPFARLVQEILLQYVSDGYRIQREALSALQESAECYLTQYFEDSYACTMHARRSTLIPRDMGLVKFLRKRT